MRTVSVPVRRKRPFAPPLTRDPNGTVYPNAVYYASQAAAGAFIGTYSHVALDSLMHLDIRPFAPFSDDNAILGAISYPMLHVACAVAGVAGVALWLVRQRAKR